MLTWRAVFLKMAIPPVYLNLLALHVACCLLASIQCMCMFCLLLGLLYLLHNYACKLLMQTYLAEMLIISSIVRLGFVELYDNQALDGMQFSSNSFPWSSTWSRTSIFLFFLNFPQFFSFSSSSSSLSCRFSFIQVFFMSILQIFSLSFRSDFQDAVRLPILELAKFLSFQILLVFHSVFQRACRFQNSVSLLSEFGYGIVHFYYDPARAWNSLCGDLHGAVLHGIHVDHRPLLFNVLHTRFDNLIIDHHNALELENSLHFLNLVQNSR